LDKWGHNWRCKRGYKPQGDKCVDVIVPENASLDFSGNNWRCNSGFCRSDDRCVPCQR
jgi:hypothetical protein